MNERPVTGRRLGLAAALLGLTALAVPAHAQDAGQDTAKKNADDKVVYSTYGAHNPPEFSNCEPKNCVAKREAGDPSDPVWPEHWSTKWTMYRVYNGYVENPPPYDGKPPAPLAEGKDYEASQGATYYDSTWASADGKAKGAMMEHYVKRCLPIFPLSNQYTCSFVSLGNTAYFLTYPEDRPKGMPACCLFSDYNHPPRRDFIKHLPYSKGDSERLGGKVQGYSFWVSAKTGAPVQTGVSPVRTADGDIMFGYGFHSTATPDAADPKMEPYRHPQSFYFSGYPVEPANAPIVSQNFEGFSSAKPDPAQTWDQVARMCTGEVPRCQLFDPPDPQAQLTGTAAPAAIRTPRAPTWGDIRGR